MFYDLGEVQKRVASSKKKFILRFAITVSLIIAALVIIIINPNKTLTFVSIILELVSILYMMRIFEKFSPLVLFSKEVRGINIKEDIYSIVHKSGPGMSYKQVGAKTMGGPPIAPSTGANKRRAPQAVRASVYLKQAEGSIALINGLYKSCVDVYEDGDELIKLAGTKYPMITSREVDKQPCPICGALNTASDVECSGCGLSIISR